MNLTLQMHYNSTVTLAGKAVRLNEEYDNSTVVNRFVETITHKNDEAAIDYILDTDYNTSDPHVRRTYNGLVESLQDVARIYNTFSIETQFLGFNIGAGFCALIREEDFAESVRILERIMKVLELDSRYELVTRYENQGVYAIIAK